MSVAACLFNGFSDPSRLAIVRHLALGEHRVVDLTRHLGLAQSTVSKHLACLRAERLLALTGDAVALCPIYGSDAQPVTDADGVRA